MLEVPDRTPCYVKVQCPECSRDVWYRLSRVDPEAWTPEQFDAEYVVDAEARSITPRTPH